MNELKKLLAAFLVFLFVAEGSAADEGFHPDAPEQTRHFAPLLGTWQISQRTLRRGATDPNDPAAWIVSQQPNEWRFYTILNGHAIQDDFIVPASWIDVPESRRGYGTNIRIFNEAKGHWEMAWIATAAREVWEFTATSKEGEIVMHSIDLEPPRRNFFHSFTADSFSWRQEWTFDEGKTSVAVVYIEAKRVK